jgi:hypothetical protein
LARVFKVRFAFPSILAMPGYMKRRPDASAAQQPPAGENVATQPPHTFSQPPSFEVSGGLDASSQTPIQQQQQQQRTWGAAIFKVVVVYCLLLAVRHLVHGDAAYFSADLIVKVANLLIPLLRSLTGYTPTIISVIETIAVLPCLYLGFMFARRVIGVNRRVALMQYAFILFVAAPVVFVASTHFRNSLCGGDPHDSPVPPSASTSAPSVHHSSPYVSPHATHGSSGEHAQDARVHSVMTDLGKHQFLVFCALGVSFSSVCSCILLRLIDA